MESELGINRSLLKELIELRQMRSERESILRTNQYYIAQVSQMEIRISELKASLQAKDSEIKYLQQNIREHENNGPRPNKDLEEEIILLEAENEHLKKQVQEAGEISQLKIQLEYALRMKETFEEKYREAKTLLLTKAPMESENGHGKTEPKYLDLEKELENCKKKLGQYQNQCLILSAENEELLKKCENDQAKSPDKSHVPVVKSLTCTDSLKFLNTNFADFNKFTAKSDPLSTKSSSYANIAKPTKLNNSRVAKSSMLPLPKAPLKSEVVEYCPSFMRNKKSDYKNTPTPSIKKNSVNSFADDFPDDEEF